METLSYSLTKIATKVILAISLFGGILQAQPTWTEKSAPGFSSGWNATGFSIGDKGYIVSDKYAPGRVVWEYDPATDVWTQKAWYPGEGEYGQSTGFSIGTKGYLGLGYRYSGAWQFTKDFWEFDPEANTWTRKADFGGAGRRLASGFSIGTKGYIGVGLSGGISPVPITNYSDFWEYNPATDTWTQKTDFPVSGAYKGGAFSINSKGYLCSGTSFWGGNSFWEYDPSLNTWIQKADFPGSSGYNPGFSIGNKGYMGVETLNPNFYEYDQPTNTWTRVADFPAIANNGFIAYDPGRDGNIAFSIGTKGYLGQGSSWSGPSGSSVNDFWEFTPPTTSTSCIPPSERAALDRLYASTNGENWTNKWTGNDESTWYGVTISGCSVTEITLNANNLTGRLPDGLEYLTSLTKLDLSGNQLSGILPAKILSNVSEIDLSENILEGELPTDISNSLVSINLSSNKLSGSIPVEVGNAVQLQTIDFSNNQLTGEIPTQIGNLTELKNLDLSGNQIIGSVPNEISTTQLINVDLSRNKLTGISSSIWNLSTINTLNVSSNQITGSLPIEIGNASSLVSLDLSDNDFTGKIPEQIASAPNLSKLNLSGNEFTDSLSYVFRDKYFSVLNISNNNLSYIPEFYWNLQDTLNVENNQLTFEDLETSYQYLLWGGYCCKQFTYAPQKEIAHEIVQKNVGDAVLFRSPLSKTGSNYFQWYKNNAYFQFSDGTYNYADSLSINPILSTDQGIYTFKVYSYVIPDLVLTGSYILNLGGATTGIIPAEERDALVWLYYSTNGGSWYNKANWLNADESTWAGVTVTNGSVTQLSLGYNNLSGSLPEEIGDLIELEYLYITSNYNLTGSIPSSLGNLIKLKQLSLSYNSFSGAIPASLGNLSELIYLDIGENYQNYQYNNSFSGSLPSELGNLTQLTYLAIDGDNNLTSGPIPSSFSKLTNLYQLNLKYCNLSGTLPLTLIEALPNLQYLDLSYNQLNGTVPVELRRLGSVNLGNNQLTGTLPVNLGTTGSNLYSLDLRFNLLDGGIPVELGTWDNLNYLTLRGNQFSGNIPTQLGDMDNLYSLDIGQNQLTGTIPVALTNAIKLNYLSLDNNQLTGTIPKELGNLNLYSLQLNNNQLTGILPVELGNAINLYNLRLDNNQLSGSIPTQYGALTKLQSLYLNNNLLTGALPSSLGNLNKLYNLSLAYNQLSGTIPSGMGRPDYMYELFLNDNLFSGALPNYYGTITNGLYRIRIQNNQFTDIPAFTATYVYELATEKNLLDFGDLELNAGTHNYFWGHTYSPQNTILQGGSVNSTIGCPLTIPFTTPGAFNQYQWYKDGVPITGATSKEFTLTNGYASDAGSYTVSVTNTKVTGLTLTSAPWVVTIGGAPLTPPIAVDVSACSSSALTLTATGASGAQEYRWYDVAVGGTSLASTSTFTTPVLTSTTSYYVSIFDPAGSCESVREEVAASIVDLAPTTTGGAECGTSVFITLSASGGTDGQYRWYTTDTGGTPIAGEVNGTFITPPISTTTTYYVSINNGVCESARAAVVATVSTLASALASAPPPICDSGSATLTASGGVDGQYRWYTTATGGSPIAGEFNSTYVIPTTSSTLSYFVSINNGACESNRTEVIVTVATSPGAPSVVGNQDCQNTAIALSASGGVSGQYRWYDAPTGGTAISGFINDTFTTPVLTTTTSYFVSINDGTCESGRTEVMATVIPLPTAPGVQPVNPVCPGSAVTLTATGGADGDYRWYDNSVLIAGEVNSALTVSSLVSTKPFQVSIHDGTCESNKTSITATVQNCTPPVVASTTATAFIEGIVTIDLEDLVTDEEDNIDQSRLQITSPPASGAFAEIVGFELQINYAGFPFVGSDEVGIEACDFTDLCTTQTVTIELSGTIKVYNAVSPNGDGKNEFLTIEYIDILPETQSNKVSIYNRWGDEVFSTTDYNNNDRVFKGDNKNGKKLSSGTYFYKIIFPNGKKPLTGFLELKY